MSCADAFILANNMPISAKIKAPAHTSMQQIP